MLFSVVTVVLNDKEGIKKTLQSVYNQTNKDYEYIIIDGKSSDGTCEVINEFKNQFIEKNIVVHFISEPDNGIYDAMNKSLSIASGEYVVFVNSGDSFWNNSVLDTIKCEREEGVDVIYGDVNFVLGNWERIIPAEDLDFISVNMPFCHQSTFVRTELLRKYRFNEKYKICADYDMFLRMYKDGITYKKINIVISRYIADGVSMSDYGRRPELEKQIIKLQNGLISEKVLKKNVFRIYLKYYYVRLKYIVKIFVPQKMIFLLREKRFIRQGWQRVENK